MMIDDTICAITLMALVWLVRRKLLLFGIWRRLDPNELTHPHHTHVVLALGIAHAWW